MIRFRGFILTFTFLLIFAAHQCHASNNGHSCSTTATQSILHLYRLKAERLGLATEINVLAPKAPESTNAFRPLFHFLYNTFNKSSTESTRKAFSKNKITFINSITKIITNKTLRYPDAVFYLTNSTTMTIFLDPVLLFDSTNQRIRNKYKNEIIDFLIQYSHLLQDAVRNTFEYVIYFISERKKMSLISSLLSDTKTSLKELQFYINTIQNIKTKERLETAFNGDLIFTLHLIEMLTHSEKYSVHLINDFLQYMLNRAILARNGFSKLTNPTDNLEKKYNTLIQSESGSHLMIISAGSLIPFIETAKFEVDRAKTVIKISLEIFHKIHNMYPSNLTQLKPVPLEQIPNNPMTDKPFKYTLLPSGEYELNDE